MLNKPAADGTVKSSYGRYNPRVPRRSNVNEERDNYCVKYRFGWLDVYKAGRSRAPCNCLNSPRRSLSDDINPRYLSSEAGVGHGDSWR